MAKLDENATDPNFPPPPPSPDGASEVERASDPPLPLIAAAAPPRENTAPVEGDVGGDTIDRLLGDLAQRRPEPTPPRARETSGHMRAAYDSKTMPAASLGVRRSEPPVVLSQSLVAKKQEFGLDDDGLPMPETLPPVPPSDPDGASIADVGADTLQLPYVLENRRQRRLKWIVVGSTIALASFALFAFAFARGPASEPPSASTSAVAAAAPLTPPPAVPSDLPPPPPPATPSPPPPAATEPTPTPPAATEPPPATPATPPTTTAVAPATASPPSPSAPSHRAPSPRVVHRSSSPSSAASLPSPAPASAEKSDVKRSF